MKKLLCSLALGLTSLSCLAHDDCAQRVLSTNGYGEVRIKPNIAEINLQVNATNTSGKAAKQEVDDRVNDFLDKLKNMKIAGEDIVASNLRISPRYEYRPKGERQFVGYEASRNLAVTVRELARLTDLLDAALASRIGEVENIRYDSSEAEKHQLAAHQLAIANSKIKARNLAKAYSVKLGPVINISYFDNKMIYDAGKNSLAENLQTMALANPSRPGVYLPDEITYTDNIQVVFELMDEN